MFTYPRNNNNDNNNKLPSGKDLVVLCMDVRYYQHEDSTRTQYELGEDMAWVGCPQCKDGDSYKYSIDLAVNRGFPFVRPSQHYTRCVNSRTAMETIVRKRMAAKRAKKDDDDDDDDNKNNRDRARPQDSAPLARTRQWKFDDGEWKETFF
jgi:hypothetical protein